MMAGLRAALSVVALLCFLHAALAADACGPLTATFTVSPHICKVSYNVPSSQQNNNTGGDALATLFNGLTTLPSEACAKAYSAYYCSEFYPQCAADNTTKVGCASTCNAVISACASSADTAVFATSSLPLPSQDECNALSTDAACGTAPTIDVSAYYTDCDYYNKTKYTDIESDFQDGWITCQPNHTVPLANMSYTGGIALFNTFKLMGNVPDDIYNCLKPFSNFYCYQAFPYCPAEGSVVILPVCRAACKAVQTACANYTDYFSPTTLQIPSDTVCNSFPEVNCATPQNNDTTLAFYFGGDPPPVKTPTTTGDTPHYYSTTIVYPPGGPAAGGGIGAGVLAGMLAIIGILMLIMKKQDTR